MAPSSDNAKVLAASSPLLALSTAISRLTVA